MIPSVVGGGRPFPLAGRRPSPTMRAPRPGHLPPALAGVAEALPFPDDSFDAAMAMVTLHQWSDPAGAWRSCDGSPAARW
jgi:hypothetical protein